MRGLARFFGEALASGRAHLETRYRSEVMQALFAPWVLHCGLSPESAYGGEMVKVIGFALEAAGAPIVKGGAQKVLDAFEKLITDQGGGIRTGADVERIELDGQGKARGVRLADGSRLSASQGVICSVAPGQLYHRLLKDQPLPAEVSDGLARFRYGKGNMQMHYALSAPPRWKSARISIRSRCCI